MGQTFKEAAQATGLKYTEQTFESGAIDAPGLLKAYFPKGKTILTPGFQKLLEGLEPLGMAPPELVISKSFLINVKDAQQACEK